MAKKNYGGHTTEQMAREVDELVARYEEAEKLLEAARESERQAEARVAEARDALDRATLAFVDKLPSPVRQSISRSYSERIRREGDVKLTAVAVDGGSPVDLKLYATPSLEDPETPLHFCASVPCPTCQPLLFTAAARTAAADALRETEDPPEPLRHDPMG